MMPLAIAVFLASLSGSLHCAGMCGAFLAFAIGLDGRATRAERLWLQVAYHVGRLTTYMTLGVIAGSLGATIDMTAHFAGAQRLAMPLAGGIMIVFGMLAIARLNGVRVPKLGAPHSMQTALSRVMRFANDKPPLVRALATGLATTLLPCGWLYAFVVVAAGTASPALGALAMSVFWLGTLPVLVALGSGVQALLARTTGLGQRVPVVMSTAIVCMGLITLVRGGPLGDRLADLAVASRVPDRTQLIEYVHSVREEPPVCHDGH